MRNLSYYFLVLDIETSKATVSKDERFPQAVWLSYAWCKLYNLKGETIDKCYFRTWFELRTFFYKIQGKFPNYKIICYVHNLAYEFDFLIKNLSKPIKMLANGSHDVISATLEDFTSIEFRCTLQLTGYSLRKIGEIINYPKLESDYRTIYPADFVTKEEIEYCERDCDIVAKYITTVALKEYGKIFDIPYTKTGRVRRTYNNFYSKLPYKPKWDLMPDEDCYEALLDSFQGGICISNPLFTAIELKNVHSYDIKSSYPYALLSGEYPYTIRKAKTDFLPQSLLKEKFWIAKICFYDISTKFDWGWLTKSKMSHYHIDSEFFNGKLLSSEWVVRTVTNVDFDSINLTYNYSSLEILEYYVIDEWGTIPQPYVDTIKHYSHEKHRLKNELKNDPTNKELDIEYRLAKADFNSIYGMCVQKLMKPEFYIDEFYIWHEKDVPYKQTNKHIKRNFLFGIYCTAYARNNILKAAVKNCPKTLVYIDTDSLKFIGDNNFVDTNKRLSGEYSEIDSIKDLGMFEYEGTYKEFKTLGAKKYASYDGVDYSLTVSGLPKSVAPITSLKEFECGKLFERCKLAKRYLNNDCYLVVDESQDDRPIIDVIFDESIKQFYDSNLIDSNGGVALYETSYLLDMTYNDKCIIKNKQKGIELWLKRNKLQNGTTLNDYFITTQAFTQ